ncbi:PrpF domain-containing protein [Mycolicibacterium porcinum]|uniref:PrpF domain-containing protein n=2 Tax=Mycolicibacterium porcinum TaxID=39693 RepID=A0AAW5T3I1_9MYCO|nr:PrpF domain-containing protein [Mycolicibacterium porcinum]MCV7389247.1 PrpF, AcnD-accessory [Mycolicibacterium porcinum]OCB47485.1 PrpF, AcnD-accessory [Mycolicibacterium vulneris]ORB44759.1 PrpF, AcnD-accessory [Mycolicibacterium porcinum]CDO27840.1 3-methylitaconate isomerase [Mycolicibacterium vulneris]
MLTLRATWMRGGTSKCWLFNAVDVDPLLPTAGGLDALLTSAFGSGDPRQLDGVGGGSSTTSKAAIVRRSNIPGIDVDYLFAQVAIGDRRVEWGSNCGNCATAIGLYALQTGLVAVDDSVTVIRMRNQNTGAVLNAEIATPGGIIPIEGDAAVPGTNALGVPVGLSFTGLDSGVNSLLPTGHAIDYVDVAGGRYPATMLNAGAPASLFNAADLGLTGTEDNAVIAEQIPLLIALRQQSSLQMGLSKPGEPISHAVPKVGIVGPPRNYRTGSGQYIAADDYDVSVRMLSMLAPHPAIGLTSAVAVTAASTLAQSTVSLNMPARRSDSIRLGTPAGVLHAHLTTTADGTLESVTLHRAARRIAAAELFVAVPALVGAAV